MAKQETTMTLYEKLAKIRASVEVMKQDKAAYGYSYTSDAELLAKITGLMNKYHISLVPLIVPGTTNVIPHTYSENKQDKAGNVFVKITNEVIVKADTLFRWVNDKDPNDFIEVPWTIVGQQSDASQAFGSGMTYCRRYFLLHYFNVSTVKDDPDEWRSKQREAADAEDAEVKKAILEQVGTLIKEHLAANPDDRAVTVSTVEKYAREKNGKPSGNYNMISTPEAAAALLADLRKAYGMEDTNQKEE